MSAETRKQITDRMHQNRLRLSTAATAAHAIASAMLTTSIRGFAPETHEAIKNLVMPLFKQTEIANAEAEAMFHLNDELENFDCAPAAKVKRAPKNKAVRQ